MNKNRLPLKESNRLRHMPYHVQARNIFMKTPWNAELKAA